MNKTLINIIIGLVLFALFFGTVAYAQTTGWFEERTLLTANGTTPRVDGLVNLGFMPKIGGFVWFQTDKGYSEVYGGVTYSPKPWLQFAFGPGLEQAHHAGRVGGYVWLGNKRGSVLWIGEDGGSGPWWKLETNLQVSKAFGVGTLSERFRGSGPRIQYKLPHTPITVWAAPLFSHNGPVKGVIGVKLNF